jgi:hypothetical protein
MAPIQKHQRISPEHFFVNDFADGVACVSYMFSDPRHAVPVLSPQLLAARGGADVVSTQYFPPAVVLILPLTHLSALPMCLLLINVPPAPLHNYGQAHMELLLLIFLFHLAYMILIHKKNNIN